MNAKKVPSYSLVLIVMVVAASITAFYFLGNKDQGGANGPVESKQLELPQEAAEPQQPPQPEQSATERITQTFSGTLIGIINNSFILKKDEKSFTVKHDSPETDFPMTREMQDGTVVDIEELKPWSIITITAYTENGRQVVSSVVVTGMEESPALMLPQLP